LIITKLCRSVPISNRYDAQKLRTIAIMFYILNACFCIGSGKTAAFLVPILAQIYTNGPQANNTAAPKPAVSISHLLKLMLHLFCNI